MKNVIIVIAVLLGGCQDGWPPRPDAGMDWIPPVRGPVKPVPPYVQPTLPDGGVAVDDPDSDGGVDSDAGAQSPEEM